MNIKYLYCLVLCLASGVWAMEDGFRDDFGENEDYEDLWQAGNQYLLEPKEDQENADSKEEQEIEDNKKKNTALGAKGKEEIDDEIKLTIPIFVYSSMWAKLDLLDFFLKSKNDKKSWFSKAANQLLLQCAWCKYTGSFSWLNLKNIGDSENNLSSALLFAIVHEQGEHVRILLENGADIFYIDQAGNDAFSIINTQLAKAKKNGVSCEKLYAIRTLLRRTLIEQASPRLLFVGAKSIDIVIKIISEAFNLSRSSQEELRGYFKKVVSKN